MQRSTLIWSSFAIVAAIVLFIAGVAVMNQPAPDPDARHNLLVNELDDAIEQLSDARAAFDPEGSQIGSGWPTIYLVVPDETLATAAYSPQQASQPVYVIIRTETAGSFQVYAAGWCASSPNNDGIFEIDSADCKSLKLRERKQYYAMVAEYAARSAAFANVRFAQQ